MVIFHCYVSSPEGKLLDCPLDILFLFGDLNLTSRFFVEARSLVHGHGNKMEHCNVMAYVLLQIASIIWYNMGIIGTLNYGKEKT